MRRKIRHWMVTELLPERPVEHEGERKIQIEHFRSLYLIPPLTLDMMVLLNASKQRCLNSDKV